MGDTASLILLAAGSGTRLGLGRPKALAELCGRPVVAWAVDAAVASGALAQLVLVVPPGEEGREVAAAVGDAPLRVDVVEGGARRRDSVAHGLELVIQPSVLVHDAARVLAKPTLFAAVARHAADGESVVPGLPVPDTLVRCRDGVATELVSRDELFAVQTPQGFSTPTLRRAHEEAPFAWDAPDDGSMVSRMGLPVRVVPGEAENFKVTWGQDLERAARVLARRGQRGDAG
jgi:2-C-methyl-D-erythritol 4-phosphate cytidylyltransferase